AQLPAPVGRAATPARAGPAGRDPSTAMAARRADHRARCRRPGAVRRDPRHPPARGRNRDLRDPSRPAGHECADPPRARRREPVMNVGAAIAWGVRRDLALAMRSRAEIAIVLVFFVLVTSLFPLGLEPDPVLLAKIAPGIAWVAALLASLLGLPRLFAADHADGSLEQLALAPAPLPALVAGKV